MDFNLTQEQSLLRDSVRRYIEKEYEFEQRRKRVENGEYFKAEVWAQLVEYGWVGAALSEAEGGYGGAVEAMLVAQELGRGLVLEPYVQMAAMSGKLLAAAGQQSDYIESLVGGEHKIVVAHDEAGPRHKVSTSLRKVGAGYQIDGAKQQIIGAGAADILLVSVSDERQRLSVVAVPANAAGVSMRHCRLLDGSAAADVEFSAVIVAEPALVGEIGQGAALIAIATRYATTMLCAQAVGAMEKVIELTSEYLNTRKQFGVLIGSFQALQHRLADMVIYLEQARTMVFRAVAYLDESEQQSEHAVAATKALLGRAAKFVAAQGIQLHGGIGVTEEYSVGHYFKFLTVAESLFGNSADHIKTLAEQTKKSAIKVGELR
jgi:alkylation response protein AidB-like acyl-CoA dehydrogenase